MCLVLRLVAWTWIPAAGPPIAPLFDAEPRTTSSITSSTVFRIPSLSASLLDFLMLAVGGGTNSSGGTSFTAAMGVAACAFGPVRLLGTGDLIVSINRGRPALSSSLSSWNSYTSAGSLFFST